MKHRIRRLSVFSGFLICLSATSLEAATMIVTKTADTNDFSCDASDCSLREALIDANADNEADTILLPEGTITLAIPGTDDDAELGDLDVLNSVTIVGKGADKTILDGADLDRVFDVNPGNISGIAVTITDLTIRNGIPTNNGAGGGIRTTGELTVERCRIVSNETTANGGGVAYGGGRALTIIDTTINANKAVNGGGLGATGLSGPLKMTNVTVSGNEASNSGGGMTLGFSADLANVTVAFNRADSDADGGGDGGGILSSTASWSVKHSLIALNEDFSPTGTTIPDCGVGGGGDVPSSQGYNLVGVADTCSGGIGFSVTDHDQIGSLLSPLNPKIGPLSPNGGPTSTHALLAGSPALNAGDPAGCTDANGAALASDQRGFDRSVGGRCDIGAFESGDCGDGFIDATENCDDGNAVDTDTCTSTCELADCGDGFVRAGVEECDDGNAEDGDGCSSACAVETPGTTGDDTTGGATTGDGTGGETTGGEAPAGGCSLIAQNRS